MRYGSVKHIALYYKAIPGMLRLLRQERTELEGNYCGLRGLACDGMPRGSSPGKPTEESGLRALENGVSERLAEIAEAERVLSGDEACIRACLDALNGKYKEVIVMRYVRGYSWAKISARMGTADSTARDWHTRAMERLGEVLEELPEADALSEAGAALDAGLLLAAPPQAASRQPSKAAHSSSARGRIYFDVIRKTSVTGAPASRRSNAGSTL